MARFFIRDMIHPTSGRTDGQRWNGWACPYFTLEQGLAIVAAWRAFYVDENDAEHSQLAGYDEERRVFWFYSPDPDAVDDFPAITIDGETVWAIGSHCWTWENEADLEGGSWCDDGATREPSARERLR